MKKYFFLLVAFVCLCLYGYSQPPTFPDRMPLQIGDTMPDVLIPHISNYKTSSAHFSEFKNKLVILDFWFGTCKGCLLSFPKIEHLQQRFKDSIQILMVNYESEAGIDSVFNKLRKRSYIYRKPNLPSANGDTIFHSLFEFQAYPHEVWIDGAGVVRYFTSSSEVNEENITAMIRKGKVKMDQKFEDLSFKLDSALLPQVYKKIANANYYSCILPYIYGLYGGMSRRDIDSAAGTVRISRKNLSILELFGCAIARGAGYDPYDSPVFDFGKRVVLKVKDSSRYFYSKAHGMTLGEWKNKNAYCYESLFPLGKEPFVFNYMLQDLERFFNIDCKIEKRKMKCLALVRTSAIDKIKSVKKLRPGHDIEDRDSTLVQMNSLFMPSLIRNIAIENKKLPYTFIDNTGYTGRIDVEIHRDNLKNIPALKKELSNKYDLDLVETQQEVDCLILTEATFEQNKNVVTCSNGR